MRFVVIGASAAGVNGVRELRRLNPDAEIILVSKDREIYSRCILHYYLGGLRSRENLCFAENDFEELYRVNWMKERTCEKVCSGQNKIILDDGTQVIYDKLLIAAGSSTFIPPIPGIKEASHVYGFRNIDDIDAIMDAAKTAEHIVILGGGLIGIDAADGLIHLGHKPTMIEMADRLLFKQLDHYASSKYKEALEAHGATVLCSTGLSEIMADSSGRISKLKLSTGEELPCDLLILTTGVRACIGFLEDSGLTLSTMGLVINANGETNIENIYGAGDISGTSPIWPNAVKEGIIAASNMSGEKRQLTDFFASKSTMNFFSIPSLSLGVNEAPDDSYQVETLVKDNLYKKIIHKDGKIAGAVFQGDLSYCGILTQLIANNIDISKVKKSVFDIDYSDFFNIKENFEFYYEEEDVS